MNTSGYAVGGSQAVGTGGASTDKTTEYWSLQKCKRAYLDYLGSKRAEIDEQQQSRRYRHGVHWTTEQVDALNKRKQPVVTYNRIGRKIDGVIGLVEKLRKDPKAAPRTPKHEQGAELATAVLRYVLDQQEWKAKSPIVAENGAVDGIGGIEIELTEGDRGDKEISFDVLDPDGFFYDPRSFRLDFSDARYMGQGKWLDADTAKEMFPDRADEIDAAVESGHDLSTNSDRDNKWFDADGDVKRLRLVDIWYQHKGGWCWAIFTGSLKLMEGKSYLEDEKGKQFCKYIAFSASVDHDGDRYGFVRNLKSANDEINQRRSKGLHELNARRLKAQNGAFDNIERARREAARPDGVLIYNPGFEAEFDDTARIANIEGQFKFLEDAKAEIENFGPNPALMGQGLESQSGRAIALLQEAGIAELGPYILSYTGWKLRVYRAIWNAVQRHWTAERWIRVTDNEGLAQFIQVNAMQPGPMGLQMVNALGSLDVDIILDEGPDTINAQAEVYETLTQILPAIAPMLTPQMAQAVLKVLINSSGLPSDAKKEFREVAQQSSQPDPMQQQAQQIAMAGEMAKVKETESKAVLNYAKANEAQIPEMAAPQQAPEFELPPDVQIGQAVADIERTYAERDLKLSQAHKTQVDAQLAPQQAAHDAQLARAQFAQSAKDNAEDRKLAARKQSQATATRGTAR
jgi:hypothetical protein